MSYHPPLRPAGGPVCSQSSRWAPVSSLPHPGGKLGSVQAERVRGALARTTPCHSPGLAPACLHSHRLTLEGRLVCPLVLCSPCRPAPAKALLGHSRGRRCPGGPAQEHVSVSRPEAGAGSPTFTNFLFVVVRGYTLSDLNFLNLLRLQCPIVWSLLVNVPRVPERNTYSAVVRGNSPLNVKWVSWLTV